MLRTLFYIPAEIAGVPMFGFGLLLVVWAVASLLLLGWLLRRQGLNADTLGYVPLLLLVGAAIYWVLPALSEAEGLPVRSYGTMLLIAVVSGTALAVYRAGRVGVSSDAIFALAFWGFLGGIAGARLFYVIEYWPTFQRPTLIGTVLAAINIAEGGLVVYGSLLGGLVGLLYSIVRQRLPVLAALDLIAPCMVLGLAIGRFGCLLNGCCYGHVTECPWGIAFPWQSPAHIHQVEHGQTFLHGLRFDGDRFDPAVIAEVDPHAPAAAAGLRAGQRIIQLGEVPISTVAQARYWLLQVDEPGIEVSVFTADVAEPYRWTVPDPLPRSRPVHPTQLYSSINALLLCLLLLSFEPYQRRDGQLFALLLTIYPVTRFLLEVIRTDESAIFGTGLSISQNVSLLILLGIVLFWSYVMMQPPGNAFVRRAAPGRS